MNMTVADWIARGAVPLIEGKFTKNGTYSARSLGAYGYSGVTVDVPIDTIVGTDPETGEETVVKVVPDEDGDGGDGGGGEGEPGTLVKDTLPAAIEVTKLPDRSTYLVGEAIDYAGTQARALMKSGEPWDGLKDGRIPYGELVFPVARPGMYFPEYSDSGKIVLHKYGSLVDAVREVYKKYPPVYFDHPEYFHWDSYYKSLEQLFAIVLRDVEQYEAMGYEAAYIITCTKVDAPAWGANNSIWEPFSVQMFPFEDGDVIELGEGMVPHIDIHMDGYVHIKDGVPYIRMGNGPGVVRQSGSPDVYPFVGKKSKKSDGNYLTPPTESLQISLINAPFPSGMSIDIPLYHASSDLDCGISQPIEFSTRGKVVCAAASEGTDGGGGAATPKEYLFEGARFALSYAGSTVYYVAAAASRTSFTVDGQTMTTDAQFTDASGRRVHYKYGTFTASAEVESVTPATAAGPFAEPGRVAWTMVYGAISEGTTDYPVPVQWKRHGDDKVLETTMKLKVATPA